MNSFLEKIKFYSAHIIFTLICINDSIFINTWIAPGPIIKKALDKAVASIK